MNKKSTEKLFSGITIGSIPALAHRVVMAPLTRLRSEQPGDIPNALMLEYYTQRASNGGLLITEATTVAITGRGYLGAPGIYSDAQVAGWQRITSAVHARGARIVLQLWHVGRASHVDMTGGEAPVGPSVVPYEGLAFTQRGWVAVSPNRALKTGEIPTVVEAYRQAAARAQAAGFDGVEIHGANGYLLDQFLQDGSNQRDDAYGGPIENRARLLLEVTTAIISVWGGGRVGVRLGPGSKFNAMSDTNSDATFGYAADSLRKLGIAYLHLIEPRIDGNVAIADGLPPVAAHQLKHIFRGIVISAGGFEPETAEEILATGDADLVAFGRHFIANPDLPRRIRLGLPLNHHDRGTFYGGDHRGYTDYPFYQDRLESPAQPKIHPVPPSDPAEAGSELQSPVPATLLQTSANNLNNTRNNSMKNSNTAKPSIVLVHGAFADASGWLKVILALENEGYFVTAVQLPLKSLADDIATTLRVLEVQTGEVVLVGHSYGGAVITGASALSAKVKALVYVAAFALDEGETLGALIGKFPDSSLPSAIVPDSAGFLYIDRVKFRNVFAGDLSASEAGVMAATQKPIAAAIFGEPLADAGWRTIRSWYLLSTEDHAINPDLQHFMAARIKAETIELPSSHVAFLSLPTETVNAIKAAAEAAPRAGV